MYLSEEQLKILKNNKELKNLYGRIKSMKLRYVLFQAKDTGTEFRVKIRAKRLSKVSSILPISLSLYLEGGGAEHIHAGHLDRIVIHDDHIILYETEKAKCMLVR